MRVCDIPLQLEKNGSGSNNREYEIMSPVSVDPEKLMNPAPLSAIEERLTGGGGGGGLGTPGTPVHARSDSSSSIGFGGARPKQGPCS